jgi:hypothetical protein
MLCASYLIFNKLCSVPGKEASLRAVSRVMPLQQKKERMCSLAKRCYYSIHSLADRNVTEREEVKSYYCRINLLSMMLRRFSENFPATAALPRKVD